MGIRDTFKREVVRMGSRRLYVMTTLVLPIIGILFFAYLFSGSVPRNLPIAICDQDQSQISAKLVRMINATSSVDITKTVMTPEEGEGLIKTGDIYGLVYIPKDFQNDILRGQCPSIASYYNNVYLVAAGLIKKDITTVIRTFAAGINLNKRIKKGESKISATVAVNPIAVNTHILFNPYMNYFYYIATAFIPLMLIMFVLSTTVYAIGIELKDGTSKEWLETSGGVIWKALLGKLLPYFICFYSIGMFMNSLLFRYFGVPQNGNIFIVSYNTLVLVVSYIACGIFIISIFSSLRMALSVASLFSALAFTFSGLTYPLMAMYDIIEMFGQIFPFTHYLKIFVDQTMRAAPIEYSWQSLIAIHLFWFLPLITNRRLERVCLNEKFWGKS